MNALVAVLADEVAVLFALGEVVSVGLHENPSQFQVDVKLRKVFDLCLGICQVFALQRADVVGVIRARGHGQGAALDAREVRFGRRVSAAFAEKGHRKGVFIREVGRVFAEIVAVEDPGERRAGQGHEGLGVGAHRPVRNAFRFRTEVQPFRLVAPTRVPTGLQVRNQVLDGSHAELRIPAQLVRQIHHVQLVFGLILDTFGKQQGLVFKN